jgi:hypothetical protein
MVIQKASYLYRTETGNSLKIEYLEYPKYYLVGGIPTPLKILIRWDSKPPTSYGVYYNVPYSRRKASH